VLAAAAPVLFAVIGETISERAGWSANLSMNGSILLSAMAGVCRGAGHRQPLAWFSCRHADRRAGGRGGGFASITLKQSQVAVGFILALLCRDLSISWQSDHGREWARAGSAPILFLSQLPVLGPLFSSRCDDLSELRTADRGLGLYLPHAPGADAAGYRERPAAAFVRGANVTACRYFYTILGGALIGLAGPIYSLSSGWLEGHHLRAGTASVGSRSRSPSSRLDPCARLSALISLRSCSGLGWCCSGALGCTIAGAAGGALPVD